MPDVLKGLIPQKQVLHRGELTMALGIVGATVMPHNLYLGSSISQSRKYNRNNEEQIANALRFSTWDSNIQLSAAFFVNCLLNNSLSANFSNLVRVSLASLSFKT